MGRLGASAVDTSTGGDTAPEAGTEKTSEISECEHVFTGVTVLAFTLLCIAVGILVVLAFTKRRKRSCPECCDRRPGLIIPVNLHHTGRYRLVYAIIFGAMSNVFLVLALTNDVTYLCSSTGWSVGTAFCRTVVSPVILVIHLSLLYAPVFACVNAPLPIVGHVLGLFYTAGLVILLSMNYGLFYKGCYGVVHHVEAHVLSDAPMYMFFAIILMWYCCQIGRDILAILRKSDSDNDGESMYYFKHVTNLLKKKPSSLQTWIGSCFSYCWPYNKNFRIPLRFLAPLMVMITILFKLSFGVFIRYITFFDDLVTRWKNNGSHITQNLQLKHTSFYSIILDSLRGFYAVGVVASLLTFVLCLTLLVHMVAVVHKNLELAAQGKFSIYSGKPPSHAFILAFSLKYSSYQIGYFIWAWMIYFFGFFVIGSFVIAIILGLKYYSSTIVPLILLPLVGLIGYLLVAIGEVFMCKYIFLKKTKGKFLMITNKNAFSWVSFFLFLYNVIEGFLGAILRALLALLFELLLLFRLDTNIMMRGFQFADWGNKAYQGFLYVENTHNNFVVNAFVAVVTKGQQGRNVFANSFNPDLGESAQSYGAMNKDGYNKRRTRNRWLVAYTLVHNPSLCQLRASRLGLQNRQEEEEDEEEWGKDETSPLLRFR